MRIEIQSYKKKYIVETENDDLCIDEYFHIIIGLFLQSGFHKETIDRAILDLSDSIKSEFEINFE